MKSMSASAFKAHCLAVMDEVARTGEPVAISKRGRTVVNRIKSSKNLQTGVEAAPLRFGNLGETLACAATQNSVDP